MIQNEIDSCGFGLLINLKQQKSHALIQSALHALARLSHRGAVCEDGLSGDGCGIMLQLDKVYFKKIAAESSITVNKHFAVGMCFLNKKHIKKNQKVVEQSLIQQGFEIAGWRQVPVDSRYLGAQGNVPQIMQIYIHHPKHWETTLIERNLYVSKMMMQHALKEDTLFSICSLSSRTIVYKALIVAQNLSRFYPDLHHKDFKSSIALVHQRFSTNTLSDWRLAQPFQFLAHNGEINTIQGNRLFAREFSQYLISEHYQDIHGVDSLVNNEGSDSLSMDNFLESLVHSGIPVHEALRLMLPPAWENNTSMKPKEKAFYRYHAPLLPPWEGPAGIVFFDGRYAGCILDRNGFRPAKVVQSNNHWLGIGSETGIFDFASQSLTKISRLIPGELFIFDTLNKEIIGADDFMQSLYSAYPFDKWLKRHDASLTIGEPDDNTPVLTEHYRQFDVSIEEKENLIRYMTEHGVEPTHSMGDDTPLAALSYQPRQLFDFFRQQFAQVTNPPIDSLREQSVMSIESYIAARGIFSPRSIDLAKRITLNSPLLNLTQLNELISLTRSMNFSLNAPIQMPLKTALKQLVAKVMDHIDEINLIVLTDEELTQDQFAIHPTLAVGAIYHELIKQHRRSNISLIVSSGWVREPHHIAMLIACGADAVFPWLAQQMVFQLANDNQQDPMQSWHNFAKSMDKGLLKILAKMGVCTLNSYKGGQLFQIIGLNKEIIDTCFSQCSYWVEKFDWESLDKQQKQFTENINEPMRQGGLYKYTYNAEYHDFNPDVVTTLLKAVNERDPRAYHRFKTLINERQPVMIRDFLHIISSHAIDINRVEHVNSIFKRFDTAAMSLGALSPEAHESLAIAMNALGGHSNSGEGGEAKRRHGTMSMSKIKQVASARFGVTAEYLMNAEVLQIKISQGSKPGEGGQLPPNKVNHYIAELRYCSPGISLISPPPHHDIYSIEDLAQLIFDLKQINPKAFVSVKLVSSPGVGTIAAGVVKGYADMITLSGYDGGTGASPLGSIRYTGCPWELGLIETQHVLLSNNLRHRVTLQVDGGFKTGLDVVKAALLGAESFGFGTAPLITLGCKYLKICHLNNCATGVATQDNELRQHHYLGNPDKVMMYFHWVAEEVREILAKLGFSSLQDIIGRTDLLEPLAQSAIPQETLTQLYTLQQTYPKPLYQQNPNPSFDKALLANELLLETRSAITTQTSFEKDYAIANYDRSIGANLSGEIAKHFGNDGFTTEIRLHFHGIAGQSFGAWLVKGLSLTLYGAANDYVGKGMNGGEIIIKGLQNKRLNPKTSTLAGNTCLYGATGGLCLINGLTGERFAVRNSGATAVVLGVGDHGCEYMTAGSVLILSTPGNNFAAGMTGGIVYVFDDKRKLLERTNKDSVHIFSMDDSLLEEYVEQLKHLLSLFVHYTDNEMAQKILSNLTHYLPHFYLVLPNTITPFVCSLAQEVI